MRRRRHHTDGRTDRDEDQDGHGDAHPVAHPARVEPQPVARAGRLGGSRRGRCSTAQLAGRILDIGGGAAGSTEVELALTNTGSASCTIQGWPGVSFVGDGNATQLGAAATLMRASPHPTVTLAPGARAEAPLIVAHAIDYPDARCRPQAADGFRVYPPGETASLFVADTEMTACTNASVKLLAVGAFVAG